MALLASSVCTPGSSTAVSFVAAASGGDTVAFTPGKNKLLLVKNDDASSKTPTVVVQRTQARVGGDVFTRASIATAVAAGAVRAIPLTEAYVDASGLINITYSAVTSVTVAVLEMDW